MSDIKVSQADRQSMVLYESASPIHLAASFAQDILDGKYDHDERVQAFARHRASEAERVREACAKVADSLPTDWRDGTQPGPLSAYAHAAREIAAAIRSLPIGEA